MITLLTKPDATRYDVQIDHVGFEIPTLFVLGYGLDYAQEGRIWPKSTCSTPGMPLEACSRLNFLISFLSALGEMAEWSKAASC